MLIAHSDIRFSAKRGTVVKIRPAVPHAIRLEADFPS